MKSFWLEKTIIERCEFVAAILLTLFVAGFHVAFFLHAGPLWRDEISTLSLATKSSFSEFWHSLPLDPFPASYFLLLRGWSALVLANNDLALRALGLLIGLSILAALWLSCYLIDKSAPLWPLTLFAINPLTLEGGDSIRPYGFGLIWIALAFAFIWRIARSEIKKFGLAWAAIFAILSVQSIFTNAFMLFALGVAAMFVLLLGKAWGRLRLVLGIGVIAAGTLLPYLPIFQATSDWSQIIANKNDVGSVIAVGNDALANAGQFAKWTWLVLIVALFVALFLNRKRIIFAMVTSLVAIAATIGFLCAAHYLVFPRYFLPVMAIVALSIHMFWNALPNRFGIRISSLILALAVAATSLTALYDGANTRMTNCDQIAASVEERATSDDLVIVTSFLYGISFQRYYHGQATWLAVPQLSDFSLHRWDLLKQALAGPDPIPDLLARAEKVLRDGHKIFLVGKLGPAPPEQPQSFPPAPQTEFAWQMEPYLAQWKSELTFWIEHHAVHGNDLSIQDAQPINPLERLGLFEVSGWRGD
jgi:hypothetical protein